VVKLRFVERGGNILVTARSADGPLNNELRGRIRDLEHGLKTQGLDGRVWIPRQPGASEAGSSRTGLETPLQNSKTMEPGVPAASAEPGPDNDRPQGPRERSPEPGGHGAPARQDPGHSQRGARDQSDWAERVEDLLDGGPPAGNEPTEEGNTEEIQ
jgi:hypothetical protein